MSLWLYGAGPAAVGVRSFSCASGTEGGVCFRRTLLRKWLVLASQERRCIDSLGSLVATQGDLKLSPAVWNILTSQISLLGLIAAVTGLLFFVFASWVMFSPDKTGQRGRGCIIMISIFWWWQRVIQGMEQDRVLMVNVVWGRKRRYMMWWISNLPEPIALNLSRIADLVLLIKKRRRNCACPLPSTVQFH